MTDIKLEKFEGPLELLLNLIEQEELSITEIAIATVTEQYFAYLNKLEDGRSEELADFLVIATKLVYLKSKHLLPYLLPEAEEGPSLADQLKLYKRYADASKHVEKLWLESGVAYGRIEPPIPVEGFVLPHNAQSLDLHKSITALLKRLKPLQALPQVSIDRTVSVKQKIESIYNAVKQWSSLSFRELLGNAESKTEVIVTFLALLELVKQEKIFIDQINAFDDMDIKKI